MSKITLDRDTFKVLASDTRLDILRCLDGKKLSLKDICSITRLNKATLHEHLVKLNEAELIKKIERDGHKWVYYKLSWKGKCLLHPETTKIVVLFSITFFTLFGGLIQIFTFLKGKMTTFTHNYYTFSGSSELSEDSKFILTDEITRNGKELILPNLEKNLVFQNIMENGLANTISNGVEGVDISFIIFSKVLKGQLTLREAFGNYYPDSDLNWMITEKLMKTVDRYGKSLTDSYYVPVDNIYQSNIITYDPTMLYMGLILIAAFCVLLIFGIWRFKINKTPKL